MTTSNSRTAEASPGNPGKPDTGVARRALIALVVLPTLILVVNVAATQFVAWRLHYHPALGLSLFGIYPPWSWITWMNAPWAASAQNTFVMLQGGLYGGLGLLMLLVMAASKNAGKLKPKGHEGLHGTAHFGGEAELRQAGLLPAKPGLSHQGVYCGAWPDKRGDLHYLMHDGPEHGIAMWPLRSGKLVSLVIPTAVTWPHSAVFEDPKGEIFEATAGWRALEAGNAIYRWEPGAIENTAAFNFLDEVRLGTDHEFADIANIMEAVADPDGQGLEGHWDPTAASLLNGVGLHVCYEKRDRGENACLGDILATMSDPARKSDDLYKDMITNHHRNGHRHEEIAATGQEMLNKDIRERSSIHSTAVRMLGRLRDPILRRNTSRSDFRIDDLMNADRPVSLYVVRRGQDALRLRPIVRLFYTMMFNKLMSADMKYVAGQAVSPHRRRLLVLMDEFASLRKMETMQEAMSKCAGYGIKVFLLCQDREQIINEYGQNENITSMCHVKLGVAPTNYKTAQWWSDLSGQATVVVEDVTESKQSGSSSKNYSRTYRSVGRPMMTPDEVMRLQAPRKDETGQIAEAGQVMIHVAGQPMILATQSLYFRDPEFLRRVAINAPRMSP
jgi:type IV secretion system protein VirD4